jgi:hypothetical protein
MRILLVSLVVLALGLGGAYLAVSPSAGAQSLVLGPITGSVGTSGTPDAYQISLSAGGSAVAPGLTEFDITDYSSIHNFDLCLGGSCNGTGPYGTGANSVDKTDVAGTGSFQWMVNLAPGIYTYQCDVHSSQLRGQFTVTGVASVTLGKIVPKRKLITAVATAKAFGPGPVQFTGWILKGSKKLAIKTVNTPTHPATTTLRLAPLHALTPGYYVVQVRALVAGSNFKLVHKKVYVM